MKRLILSVLLFTCVELYAAEYSLCYLKDGKLVGIMRDDGACIPLDQKNRDYQAFAAWNAKQTPPLELKDREPDPPTAAETQRVADKATIKAYLAKPSRDRTAAEREAYIEALGRLLE